MREHRNRQVNPTLLIDCPWLLLIVMPNETDIGNCLLWNLKGILTSDGERDNFGMKFFPPMLLPDITWVRVNSVVGYRIES